MFLRQEEGGGDSGLDREREKGNREEERLSLCSITSFVFFVFFFSAILRVSLIP